MNVWTSRNTYGAKTGCRFAQWLPPQDCAQATTSSSRAATEELPLKQRRIDDNVSPKVGGDPGKSAQARREDEEPCDQDASFGDVDWGGSTSDENGPAPKSGGLPSSDGKAPKAEQDDDHDEPGPERSRDDDEEQDEDEPRNNDEEKENEEPQEDDRDDDEPRTRVKCPTCGYLNI